MVSFFFFNRNSLKEKRNLHSWTYNWTNFKPCQSSIRRMEEYMSLLNNIDYGPGQCLGLFLASHQTQKQCAADFLLWSMFSDTAKRRNEAQLTKGKMWKESKLFFNVGGEIHSHRLKQTTTLNGKHLWNYYYLNASVVSTLCALGNFNF